MPYMILNRLPTEQDLERSFSIEVHSFCDAFHHCEVRPFVAKLKYENGPDEYGDPWERYTLDGWSMNTEARADWFTIVDELN
ncbi:hypothetical protein [Vibrio scophthalmi]|uniref:Uncharacterized protein n=1 Tax=Vibrio scophthalmi TaxID=45658 RepID=A0A1E3WS31_9VIBR|nr:hypothetical protein [Vibrio scophthalmi]ODS12397.1 hypothetical protein VSF3289_02701 [Vibrio scophthalmi]